MEEQLKIDMSTLAMLQKGATGKMDQAGYEF